MALIVVSYDIASNQRRRRVFKMMKNYGMRVQYSVFECLLDEARFSELRQRVKALIHPKDDSVRYYTLCALCHKTILISGYGDVLEERGVRVV